MFNSGLNKGSKSKTVNHLATYLTQLMLISLIRTNALAQRHVSW